MNSHLNPCILFAVSSLQDGLQESYFIPLLEHQVQRSQLKEDVLDFLNSQIYEREQTILVICDLLCIKQLLHQVLKNITLYISPIGSVEHLFSLHSSDGLTD